jgi:hypothetical protein
MRTYRQLPVICGLFLLSAVERSAGQQPDPAVKTVTYDVRALIAKPASWQMSRPAEYEGSRDPARSAEQLVQTLVDALEPDNRKLGLTAPDAIQVVNGTRLIVRATAAGHTRIAELLQSLTRLSDVAVIVQAQLHEVDDAFYQRLKKVKRISLEEAERRFLGLDGDGKEPPPKKAEPSLFDLLEKQPVVVRGEAVKTDNHQEIALLSRQQAVVCLPDPEVVRLGVKGSPQTILEGVAFRAAIRVGWDRRSVRLKLVEKAAAIQEILKVKAQGLAEKAVDAETPFVLESTHAQVVEVPDGGTTLIAVSYRPALLHQKERWWVLSLTCRIWIEEEEREIRRGTLVSLLPVVVADVLSNPRLKSTREFYGTPGDTRFALLNGDAWTWPADAKIDIANHQRTAPQREGKRLLGIRIDQYDSGKGTLQVTIRNAGGSDNGAVVGGCTIRYTARSTEKGWTVELAESTEP